MQTVTIVPDRTATDHERRVIEEFLTSIGFDPNPQTTDEYAHGVPLIVSFTHFAEEDQGVHLSGVIRHNVDSAVIYLYFETFEGHELRLVANRKRDGGFGTHTWWFIHKDDFGWGAEIRCVVNRAGPTTH